MYFPSFCLVVAFDTKRDEVQQIVCGHVIAIELYGGDDVMHLTMPFLCWFLMAVLTGMVISCYRQLSLCVPVGAILDGLLGLSIFGLSFPVFARATEVAEMVLIEFDPMRNDLLRFAAVVAMHFDFVCRVFGRAFEGTKRAFGLRDSVFCSCDCLTALRARYIYSLGCALMFVCAFFGTVFCRLNTLWDYLKNFAALLACTWNTVTPNNFEMIAKAFSRAILHSLFHVGMGKAKDFATKLTRLLSGFVGIRHGIFQLKIPCLRCWAVVV